MLDQIVLFIGIFTAIGLVVFLGYVFYDSRDVAIRRTLQMEYDDKTVDHLMKNHRDEMREIFEDHI